MTIPLAKYLPRLLVVFGCLQCLQALVSLVQMIVLGGLAFVPAALLGCAGSLGQAVLFFAAARILVLLEERYGEP